MVAQFVKFNALSVGKAAAAGLLNRAVSQGAENIKRSLGGLNPTPTPFAAARGRKNNLILSYPHNVEINEQQGHFIMFRIKDQVSQGKLRTPKVSRDIKQELAATEAAFGEAIDSNLADIAQLSSARGRTTKSIQLQKLEKRQMVKTIALYMPATVDVNYNVAYGDQEIGSLAMVGQSILEGLTSSGAAGTVEKLKNALKGVPDLAGEAGRLFAQTAADTVASGATALVNINRGTVITPRMELMFENVGRRDFSFTFDFIPKNPEEAKVVNAIIFNFKKYMMPEYSNPDTRREMNIPATFEISYHYLQKENPYLNKISTCFLKQMDVKYGGDRFTAYEETAVGQDAPGDSGFPPQKTQITLNFSELETMSRELIEDGH